MKFLISSIFLLFALTGSSQDIEGFGKKSNYSLNGRLNIGTNAYSYSGEGNPRYSPFGYVISGGLDAQLGPINIPLNFSFNHLNGSISSPFNLYGASPHYKWIKLHLGNRSLHFSPLVYSGRNFLGAGIELTPGNLNFTAFTGKLRNVYAFQDTLVNGGLVLPTYERNISGVKVGFGNRANKFELMGIRVKDEKAENPEGLYGDPVENLVVGASANLKLLKSISLSINTSASLFSGDQLASDPREQISNIESALEPVFNPNITTRASFAGDLGIAYSRRGYQLGIKYKRIDPYYYSLGTNYIQNDIENYTLNVGLPLLKRRLRIRGSFGWQKDNLSGQKAFTSNRLISSAMVSYLPSQDFNMMFRYSNYQHENESGLVAINDTLRILTTTHSMNLSTQLNILKSKEHTANFQVNVFRNQVVDEVIVEGRDANFSGNGISSRLNFTKEDWELSGGPTFNYNSYNFSTFSQGRIGGGFFISKSLLDKKLSTTINVLFLQNQFDGKSNGTLKTYNLNTRYKVSQSHNLSFRLYYLDNVTLTSNSYKELRFNLNYGFVFR